VFRAFLEYAQKGAPTEAAKGTVIDDRFPEVVLAELKKKGYECQTHVGVAGVFIDLAVVDPHESGRYLLGVVCDGNAYRTSRTARDRDRLRDQVLTGQGWTLHHLWCWDWFQKPADQLQKLIDAIEAAKKKTPGADPSGSKGADVTTIDRHEPQGELLTPPTGGILPSDAKGSNADSGSLLDAAIRVAAAGIQGGKDKALDAALGEVGQIIKGK
jgi:very-short-patch-repair endonuclease